MIPPHSITLELYLKRDYEPVVSRGEFCGWPYPRLPSHYDLKEYDPNMTFSVIVNNCMRSNHLPEVLFSVVNQNWPKEQFEILVVDDNSPKTPEGYPDKEHFYEIIKSLIKKYYDYNIRAFETHKNITYNMALSCNILVKKFARGEVCIFCDADVPMLTRDYMLGCAKHHTRMRKLFLCPLLWGVNFDLYKVHPRAMPDIEPIYRNYFWKFDWRNPPRDKVWLDLINQPTQWRGGSVRTEHYKAVRGYDEGSRGWGGIDPNLWSRWAQYGLSISQDWTLPAGHLPHPITSDPEINRLFGPRSDGHWGSGIVVNDENWGELDTLEEIKV
jgi:hypothetical protein